MKKHLCAIPVALLFCFSFACQNRAAVTERDEFRAQAKVEAQNKEVVSRFFDEFNKGNFEIFDELCAPEYRYYLPSYGPKAWTREEQIEEEKATFRAFPDFKVRIDKLFAEGDAVIIWGAITGTHLGEYQGLPPTGNRFEVGTMMIWKLKDGKLYEARQEVNFLDLMQPLGMELKPKEGTSSVPAPTVQQEVRRTLESFFKAVEEHDFDEFFSFFAPGDDLTVFEDKELNNWKGFVAYAEAFFKGVAELKFDIEKCAVDPIGPGVAVATGVFKGTGKTTSGENLVLRNAYTWVLIKQGDRWRLKHVHESSL